MVYRTCYFIACRRRKDGFRQRRDPQNAAAPAKMVSGSGRFRKTLPRSREDGFRQRQVPQNAAALRRRWFQAAAGSAKRCRASREDGFRREADPDT